MKKKFVSILFLAFLAVLFGLISIRPSTALADGLIPWSGNGSDNLPCDSGAHWVLAPSFGIDSATLHVNGVDYVMTQNGNGSWSADSSGALDSNLSASVSYTGTGDSRNHLQLSHCLATETPPTETSTPPTETPPTETPPTETPPTVTETPPTVTETPPTGTATPPTQTVTPDPTTPVPFDPPTVSGTPDLLPVTGADFASTNSLPVFAVLGLAGVGMTMLGFKNKK